MKALRFFFLSLLAAFSFAASAQTIEIYKDGRVIDSFTAAQVDSVVYTPTAAQPRYYYYAGWTKPESEADLAEFAETPNGGVITDINSLYVVLDGELRGPYEDWYIVVPNGISIYGPGAENSVEDSFSEAPDTTSIPGYRIFKGWGPMIAGFVLTKK